MAAEKRTLSPRCTPVAEVEFDDSERRPSIAVLEAVAEAAAVDVVELPPIHSHIDLEAIDTLFRRDPGQGSSDFVFSFCFEKWRVFIKGDGRVLVCEASATAESTPIFDSVPP